MKSFVNVTLVLTTACVLLTTAASAATVFSTTLSPANEVPPTMSTATGSATVTLNGNMLSVFATFSGLTTPDQAGHIHCCGPIGVNEAVALPFAGIVTGVTSGSYSGVFDLTTSSVYTAAFLTASGGTASSAETALVNGLEAGQTYVNIHTTAYPGGEIEGQLAATPEPATLSLGALALSTFALLRRKLVRKSQ